MLYALIIFVIILIIWIYYFQFRDYGCGRKSFGNTCFKTGDMILFKACNNMYAIGFASYFSHVGMVVMIGNTPYLFEAANTNGMDVREDQKKGIFLSPLYDRIARYKGKVYHKPLNKELSCPQLSSLGLFITHAQENMEYDTAVFKSGINCGLGIKRCDNGTNCGQILFLALIAMNLLPLEYYRKKIFHHLRYVMNISELEDGFKYEDLTEIFCAPIGETIIL